MISFPALLDRTSGTIVIQQHNIVFNSDDETAKDIVLSIARMKITMGGQNSTHYFLTDPHQPDKVICVQDQRVISELLKLGSSAAKLSLEQTKKRKFWRNLSLSTPVFITLFLIFLIPILLSFIPISWFNNMLSFKQEQKFGNFLFPLMKTELKISENHPAQKKIETLVQFIQSETPELAKLKIETYISSKSEVNAFALPGGIIVVNQGLIAEATSIEEILGVLAHEMAHVERRHSIKSMAGRLGNLAGILALTVFVGTDAVGVIAGVNNFVALKYSREDESEADRRGFEFLTNAKISSTGMISFFSKLSSKEDVVENSLAFLSTHPLSQERVAALNKLKASTTPFKPRALPLSLQELRN